MMHKIKVVLGKQDKLIISLPDTMCGQQLLGCDSVVPARIRVHQQQQQQQNRRHHSQLATNSSHISYHHHHNHHQVRRAHSLRNQRSQQVAGGKKSSGLAANWERVVEDKVKMIEMHAF